MTDILTACLEDNTP